MTLATKHGYIDILHVLAGDDEVDVDVDVNVVDDRGLTALGIVTESESFSR